MLADSVRGVFPGMGEISPMSYQTGCWSAVRHGASEEPHEPWFFTCYIRCAWVCKRYSPVAQPVNDGAYASPQILSAAPDALVARVKQTVPLPIGEAHCCVPARVKWLANGCLQQRAPARHCIYASYGVLVPWGCTCYTCILACIM